MAQSIKQGNIFGRVGSSLGKGLAEQIPKETERYRLSKGLEEIGQRKDQTPFQQFAGLAGVPGITPQMIQSGSELLKQQGIRNSYANMAKGGQQEPQQGQMQNGPSLNDVQFGNMPQKQSSQNGEIPQGNYPPGEPQIVDKNPLSPELQPRARFTPEQYYQTVARIGSQNPHLTNPEIQDLANQEEERYMKAPEDYVAQQEALEKTQEKTNKEIEKQIRKKLHIAEDQPIFSKLPGESQNRVERGVAKDLRSNPQATLKDLVNTWTDRALNNEKQKTELKNLANRSFDEKLFRPGENLEKLKSIAKSFHEFGNSEEYYNTLRSDFGLSPEGAASIAYPLSKNAENYIGKISPSNESNISENTIKYANNLGDYLTKGDSVLSVAKHIREKDPFFDIKTFLSEVRRIQDDLGLTSQQKLELNARGIDDIFPNWGDIFLFPKGGRGI